MILTSPTKSILLFVKIFPIVKQHYSDKSSQHCGVGLWRKREQLVS